MFLLPGLHLKASSFLSTNLFGLASSILNYQSALSLATFSSHMLGCFASAGYGALISFLRNVMRLSWVFRKVFCVCAQSRKSAVCRICSHNFIVSGCISPESCKSLCQWLSTKYLHLYLPSSPFQSRVAPKHSVQFSSVPFSPGSMAHSCPGTPIPRITIPPRPPPAWRSRAPLNVSHLKMHATVRFNGQSTIKCDGRGHGRALNCKLLKIVNKIAYTCMYSNKLKLLYLTRCGSRACVHFQKKNQLLS